MSEQQQREPSDQNQAGDLDEIPVEELIRITREFTRRITNQDRQRLGLELRESGHQRSIQISAPVTLQQFFSGEIDLDTDLARRFSNAPLLSNVKVFPKLGQPVKRMATAIFSSNDDFATMNVDAHTDKDATLDFTFTVFSALALRFRLAPLAAGERQRWLDLMRRPNGITFLWTHQRWEESHLIFVVREYYGRVYAFSPDGKQAAARLTPDAIQDLTDWLEDLWFPGRREEREQRAAEEQAYAEGDFAESVPEGDFIEMPLHMRRPARRRPHLRDAIPDAPEEQWADEPTQPQPLEWGASDDFAETVPDTSAPEPDDDADLGDEFGDLDLEDSDLDW